MTRTEDLKMWIFSLSINPKTSSLPYPKSGYVAIAFTLDEAITQFQKDHVNNLGVTAESLGSVTVSKLQTMIPLGGTVPAPKQSPPLEMVELPPPIEVSPDTKAQFIVNLRLATDKFLTEEKDKKVLLKIIDKMAI